MQIRLMTEKDIADIFSLWNDNYLSISSYDREKLECSNMIKLNPSSCFVAIVRNKVIGSIFGAFNGRRAWIYHLCVDKKYRNKKYGSKLLQTAIDALKQKGATKIVLGVGIDNLKTVSFYEKNGFTVMHDAVLFQLDVYKNK